MPAIARWLEGDWVFANPRGECTALVTSLILLRIHADSGVD